MPAYVPESNLLVDDWEHLSPLEFQNGQVLFHDVWGRCTVTTIDQAGIIVDFDNHGPWRCPPNRAQAEFKDLERWTMQSFGL